jgi:hypothetical protein
LALRLKNAGYGIVGPDNRHRRIASFAANGVAAEDRDSPAQCVLKG